MNKTIHIALACLLGAGIGAVIAQEFNQYFWWIGVLIGGVIGYVSYEFSAVLKAIVIAWEEVRKEHANGFARVRSGIKTAFAVTFETLTHFAGVLLVMTASFSWMIAIDLIDGKPNYITSFAGWFILSFFGLMVTAAMVSFYEIFRGPRKRDWNFWLCFVRDTNLLTVLVWWIPIGLFKLIGMMPATTKFVWRFCSRIFILIHSQFRLICMTDAMIGAIAGYLLGNAVVGGLIGAVCGVLNYWLISVRWLKLKPA